MVSLHSNGSVRPHLSNTCFALHMRERSTNWDSASRRRLGQCLPFYASASIPLLMVLWEVASGLICVPIFHSIKAFLVCFAVTSYWRPKDKTYAVTRSHHLKLKQHRTENLPDGKSQVSNYNSILKDTNTHQINTCSGWGSH